MGPNTLRVITATETSGGACFAALTMAGTPWVCQQAGPGGAWGQWQELADKAGTCRQIAMGSKIAPGGPMIVLLDAAGWSWALARGDGSRWDKWGGPGIGKQPYSFAVLTAARHAGSGGILAFASDLDGKLWSIYQAKDNTEWYGWRGPGWQDQKVAAGQIALAGQNNGCMILFAAHDSVVRYSAQQSTNGPWAPWEALPSETPRLLLGGIVACQQGGSRGTVLWALNQLDGQVWTVFQESPGGPFTPWNGPGFVNQPVPFNRLAASGQGNGCAMLLGLGYTGDLWAIGQTSPGGDWGAWQQLKVPGG